MVVGNVKKKITEDITDKFTTHNITFLCQTLLDEVYIK